MDGNCRTYLGLYYTKWMIYSWDKTIGDQNKQRNLSYYKTAVVNRANEYLLVCQQPRNEDPSLYLLWTFKYEQICLYGDVENFFYK